MSDVTVKFTGDTADLTVQTDTATKKVSSYLEAVQKKAEDVHPALQRIEDDLGRIADISQKSQKAAEQTSVNTYISALPVGFRQVAQGIKLVADANIAITTTALSAVMAVDRLSRSLSEYIKARAEAAAFKDDFGGLARIPQSGLMAGLGNLFNMGDQYKRSVEVAQSGMVPQMMYQADQTDKLGQMRSVMTQMGYGSDFLGNSKLPEGLNDLVTKLSLIPGLTTEAAGAIAMDFTTASGSTGKLVESLTEILDRLGRSGADTKKIAEEFTQLLNSGKSGTEIAAGAAEILNNRYKEVTSSIREQNFMQSTFGVLSGVVTGKLAEENKEAAETRTYLDQQIEKLNAAGRAADQYKESMKDVSDEAEKIVDKLNPLSTQLSTVGHQIDVMYKQYGGIGGDSQAVTTDPADLIRHFEGMRKMAYSDPSADSGNYAVGWGSHTWTDDQGRQHPVTAGTTVTQAQADANLQQRIPEFQSRAVSDLSAGGLNGQAMWDALDEKVQASLTDLVYNKGHLPNNVAEAVMNQYNLAGGDEDKIDNAKIAAAIRAVPETDPRLRERRYQEAANAEGDIGGNRGGGGEEPGNESTRQTTARLLDQYQKILDQINGGTPEQQATLAGVTRTASGRGNSLQDAHDQLVAARTTYEKTSPDDPVAKREALLQLQRAQITLSEQEAAVQKALASTDDDKLEKAKKIYAVDMQSAGDDVVKQQAAREALKAAEKEDADTKRKAAEETENSSYNVQVQGLAQRKAILSDELTTHQMNAGQKLAADQKLQQDTLTLEIDHFTKLRDLQEAGSAEYVKANDKLTEAIAKASAKRTEQLVEDNKKVQASFDEVFNKISSSVSSDVMGMIEKTNNFGKVVRDVCTDVLSSFVKMGVDMVVKWTENQTIMLVQTVLGQTKQTAAVTAGSAAQATAQTAGAASGLAAKRAIDMAAIQGDAAKAAAGAYSAVAGIPIIGPIIAPAAAGIAFAATEAFGSFDTGAWAVPSDRLAMIHQGEMIVPQRGGVAEEFRGIMDGSATGNRGTPAVHLNLSAIDGASARDFIYKNAHHIVGALTSASRSGSGAQLSRLGMR